MPIYAYRAPAARGRNIWCSRGRPCLSRARHCVPCRSFGASFSFRTHLCAFGSIFTIPRPDHLGLLTRTSSRRSRARALSKRTANSPCMAHSFESPMRVSASDRTVRIVMILVVAVDKARFTHQTSRSWDDEHLKLMLKSSFCRHVTRLTSEYPRIMRLAALAVGSHRHYQQPQRRSSYHPQKTPPIVVYVISGFICSQHMRKRREACPWPVDEMTFPVAEHEHRKGNSMSYMASQPRNFRWHDPGGSR
ncbi:hypothetical protein BGW80DRAFT_698745 [Lactifluus volemus]|nr:hypothetical protein BGW80DRAFT_698745 [Lactifluus volemus]